MQYFIGIDSSTTATKALLIDEQGDVVAVATDQTDVILAGNGSMGRRAAPVVVRCPDDHRGRTLALSHSCFAPSSIPCMNGRPLHGTAY